MIPDVIHSLGRPIGMLGLASILLTVILLTIRFSGVIVYAIYTATTWIAISAIIGVINLLQVLLRIGWLINSVISLFFDTIARWCKTIDNQLARVTHFLRPPKNH